MTKPSQFPETFTLEDSDIIPVIKGMPFAPAEHKIAVADLKTEIGAGGGGGGGGGAWEVIQVHSGAASAITFASLPSGVVAYRLTLWGQLTGGTWRLAARYNGDTGSNYRIQAQAGGSGFTQAWHTLHNADRASGHAIHLNMSITKPVADQHAYATCLGIAGLGTTSDTATFNAIWINTSSLLTSISIFDRYAAATFAAGSYALLEGWSP